jgi:N-acetylglutamate synthase-like GNAT family acetyltransferase
MQIRQARPLDADTLTGIAHDAKRHWGYPDHWIEKWQADLTISPEYIDSNQVFLAEENEQVVGFYALTVADNKAELDHMWVSPGRMGTGVGKALFVHAMEQAAGQNLSKVEIVADPNAEGFYQKMGAYRSGESISETDPQPRVLPRLTVDPRNP